MISFGGTPDGHATHVLSTGDTRMGSMARLALDENANDIDRLLAIHEQIGGQKPGRRYGLEVLNKSAIVLITAFWEAYCEDVASEGLAHIVKHAKSSAALPVELKKQVVIELKREKHELGVWKIADNGWKTYLNDRLGKLRERRNRKLNSPNAENIDRFFLSVLGIQKISDSWRWGRNVTPKRASEKLNKFIELRGAIAHRGAFEEPVAKGHVTDYFDLVMRLADGTDNQVISHVTKVSGKRFRKRLRKRAPLD